MSPLSFFTPLSLELLWIDSSKVEALELQYYFSILSLEEQNKAQKYQHALSRKLFIITRGKLRESLAQKLSLEAPELILELTPTGKPYLKFPESEIYFNISHSHDQGVIALSRLCEIGIDIERHRPMPNALDLAKRFFHSEEIDYLQALPQDQRSQAFLKLWVYKEACLKATGDGIATHLGSFSALSALTQELSGNAGVLLWQDVTCYALDTPSGFYGAWAHRNFKK